MISWLLTFLSRADSRGTFVCDGALRPQYPHGRVHLVLRALRRLGRGQPGDAADDLIARRGTSATATVQVGEVYEVVVEADAIVGPAATVLVDAIAAELRQARMGVGVLVVAIDETRVGCSPGYAIPGAAGRVVVVVLVECFVDLAIAIVVYIVAGGLRGRGQQTCPAAAFHAGQARAIGVVAARVAAITVAAGLAQVALIAGTGREGLTEPVGAGGARRAAIALAVAHVIAGAALAELAGLAIRL
jgi:hypothetical protein